MNERALMRGQTILSNEHSCCFVSPIDSIPSTYIHVSFYRFYIWNIIYTYRYTEFFHMWPLHLCSRIINFDLYVLANVNAFKLSFPIILYNSIFALRCFATAKIKRKKNERKSARMCTSVQRNIFFFLNE